MESPKPFEIDPAVFLKEHFELPPLPQCAVQIQDVILKPDVSIERICKILLKEPILIARILKIVNSAYYGFRREVDDIKFAVAYLGIHEIYNMVLSISVVKALGVMETAELDRFWNHSVLTAICAKHLGRRFEPLLSPERIWLGAILHDIGKLVYFKFFPDHYKHILDYSHKHGCLFSQGEKHFSFPSSASMGIILCDRWRLPSIVRDACGGHQLDDLKRFDGGGSRGDFRRIICSANLMAILVAEELNNELKQTIYDGLKECYSLEEKDFLKLMGEVYDLKLDLAKYEWS
ncbi:MAG: HDOD domain-containing protein [Proteobacteria bacterium]|nr:HDOD domain-containing protein [Pseudomonadota bacterium]